VGHGANDHETIIGKWELLLSVSEPGQARYGYRYTKRVPRKTIIFPGADIPVEVSAEGVSIPWDRIGAAWNLTTAKSPPPPPAPPAPSAADPDPLDQLKRLGDLRDAGVLTEAEFADEKARVLRQL
jgi:hypothetical protein